MQLLVHNEVTVSDSGQAQAQYSTFSNFTVQPLDIGLNITQEPTTDVAHSTTLKQIQLLQSTLR